MPLTHITTADIAFITDADDDEGEMYTMDNLEELADTADPGDIIECCTFIEGPRRYLVRDSDGVTALCESREAAERLAESHVKDEHWDEGATP
jgi:hypothetical protein